jgi:hypothetical protein
MKNDQTSNHPPGTVITRNHKHQANTHNLQQINKSNANKQQPYATPFFPWPSTFKTLLHTNFGSWWCCIINLGFHPPFIFHHTIFKNQQLWGPHVGHVFLPPSHLLTQPYMSEPGLPDLRTAGYQVPMLGMFSSSLVDEAIWQNRLFDSWEPSVTMCPCWVRFPAPPACWHHQCWPIIEFWPGYQVG